MSKSKSPFKALTSYMGPLMAPRSPSAIPRSGKATPATTIKTPAPTQNLVLNNLATACRITKDVAEALNKVPYIKAVTGVVAQIIKIHEEVHGNKERCNEMISIIEKYTYTILECLAELYTAEGSFQSYLEAILLNDLEPLKNQSRWKASVKRDKDIEDMRRIERELKGFVDRFTMKAVVVGVREAGATQPKLTEIQQTILREHWLRSQHAQYNIALVDASPGSVKRTYCAPHTRKPILDRVTAWARDRSSTSPAVFWMRHLLWKEPEKVPPRHARVLAHGNFGTCTITHTQVASPHEDDTFPNVVTFFCSRKFSDTNQQVFIIPTIAYQLARLCPFYSSELLKDGNVVDSLKLVAKQMDTILTLPWEASFSSRSLDSPPFLVIIDALDEIVSQEEGDEMSGGFMFLKSLLRAIDQGYLKGLKFFVTSRPHPDLSAVCQSLSSEATLRLFDIPRDEVERDIYRYLRHSLPKLQKTADHELLQLIAAKADGLFIFAATVVLIANPTPGTTMQEQRQALQGVLDGLTIRSTTSNPINSLYSQIIGDAFELRNGKALSDRLDLLHTIICTEDRVSIDVLVGLVSNESDDPENILEMVEDVLQRLHAVLWVADGRITWYHASFVDFLLSPASANIALRWRKLDASCNAPSQHATLARRCFHTMQSH
ncbi:hypothetical protein DL96DRAFT_1812759 [Flagelloscypha sp. PMI_526]|nr:hypothetical protein DL96DRAFT_1812759 [Flagelloscypha sp. PMI_526]